MITSSYASVRCSLIQFQVRVVIIIEKWRLAFLQHICSCSCLLLFLLYTHTDFPLVVYFTPPSSARGFLSRIPWKVPSFTLSYSSYRWHWDKPRPPTETTKCICADSSMDEGNQIQCMVCFNWCHCKCVDIPIFSWSYPFTSVSPILVATCTSSVHIT